MIRLLDIMVAEPYKPVAYRGADGEKPFNLGLMMDKVNRRSSNTSLLTTFDTGHSGTVVNGRCYPGLPMRDSLKFWTHPYNKPVLERHLPKGHKPGDPEPTVYGRVRFAEFVQTVTDQQLASDWKRPSIADEGSGFTKAQAGISHRGAIEELMDGRFKTVSQGSDTDHLFCSVCGNDWALRGGQCEHRPLHSYKIQDSDFLSVMYFITGRLFYNHLAKCVQPGQPYSTVLSHEFMDSKELTELFSDGKVLSWRPSRMVLRDSRDGDMEFVLENSSAQDPTSGWKREDWARAHVLTSLADAGRLKDAVLEQELPQIEAFRASDRKPDFGEPRFRIGPDGSMPLCDADTLSAAAKLADGVKGADPDSLRSRISECAGLLVPFIGESTMPEEAQKWAEIVKVSDGLDEANCRDWSGFDGDIMELVSEEGAAEERGFAAGLIAQDAKLTSASRKALPDSAFCGPNRSFPAHDAAHVRNALARLPQATRFSSEEKGRILACVRSRAKKLGVEVNADQLEFNHLVGLLDQATPATVKAPPAPDGETPDQAVKRVTTSLESANAKIQDLEGQRGRLLDENTDLRGTLHRMMARKIFDLRSELDKPDIKALDSEEKRTEFLAQLALRKTESLRDSLTDLEAEFTAAKGLTDGKTDDPTAGGLNDNADPDKGKEGKGGEAGPDASSTNGDSQADKFERQLSGGA